jgi:ribosome-binding protein aMBF1 (putative translation factor)
MFYRAYTNPEFIRHLQKKIAIYGTSRVLAEKIGVSEQTVSNWVHGKYPPSPKIAKRLEKICDIKAKISRPDLFDN